MDIFSLVEKAEPTPVGYETDNIECITLDLVA
jgi:hypothetical protein